MQSREEREFGKVKSMRVVYVTREVTFPRDLTAVSATRFFNGLGGLKTRREHRLGEPPPVILEVIGTARQIRYFLHCQQSLAPAVWGAMRGAVTHVGLLEATAPTYLWRRAVELYGGVAAPAWLDAGQIPTLLGAFAGLGESEAVSLQVLVNPVAPAVDAMTPVLLNAIGRLAAHADDHPRAEELLGRVLVAYNSISTFGVAVLPTRRLPIVNQRGPQSYSGSSFFPANTLAVLAGWPLDSPAVPGLRLGRVKHLEPDYAVSRTGRTLLVSTYPGSERPLALETEDRLRHVYLVGPTGTGKSTVMERSAVEDIQAGCGVLFIDPKGTQINRILDRIPPKRVKDVILLDFAGTDRPVGFNLLAGEDPYTITDQVCGVLEQVLSLSADSAPRALFYLHSIVLSLALVGLSLSDIPASLASTPVGHRFRQRIISALHERELREFWTEFDRHQPSDQADIAAPILRRLQLLLYHPRVRASFGQLHTGFNMDQVLAENKILLVPMGGNLGDRLTSLIGSMVMTQFWQAVRRRETYDKPFFAYLDEFNQCLKLSISFREMCDQARGFGVGLNLAHTVVGELPLDVRRAVFGNVRTKLVFQTTSREDATILAGELGEPVTSTDVTNLDAFHVIARIMAGGSVSPPLTARTLGPLDPTGSAKLVRASSESQYGRPIADVQAELDARHGITDPDQREAELDLEVGWYEIPEDQ